MTDAASGAFHATKSPASAEAVGPAPGAPHPPNLGAPERHASGGSPSPTQGEPSPAPFFSKLERDLIAATDPDEQERIREAIKDRAYEMEMECR